MKLRKEKMMSKKKISFDNLHYTTGSNRKFFLFIHIKSNCDDETCKVIFLINADQAGNYQLYYGNDTNFTEEQSVMSLIRLPGKSKIKF